MLILYFLLNLISFISERYTFGNPMSFSLRFLPSNITIYGCSFCIFPGCNCRIVIWSSLIFWCHLVYISIVFSFIILQSYLDLLSLLFFVCFTFQTKNFFSCFDYVVIDLIGSFSLSTQFIGSSFYYFHCNFAYGVYVFL